MGTKAFLETKTFHQDLINNLRTLLNEQYRFNDGLTIIKELIQNANDAKDDKGNFATELRIISSDGISINNIQDVKQPLFNHKALLIYNDGPFTEKDQNGIENIYKSGKDSSNIGRFGLGLKSIHHICDMFFYAFFWKGEWVLDGINPWKETDYHLDWKNEKIDETLCQEFLNKVTEKYKLPAKGFFLWIPLKDMEDKHITDTIINNNSPLGLPDNIITELCKILPLLKKSTNKKLVKVTYIGKEIEFSIILNERNDRIYLEIEKNKIKQPIAKASLYKSTDYIFDKDWPCQSKEVFFESLLNNNFLNEEELNNINTTIEIIKNPKKNEEASLEIKYCVFLPLSKPDDLKISISGDNDISILIHCSFSVNSGRTYIETIDNTPITQGLSKDEFNILFNCDIKNSDEYKKCLWNRFLAQSLVYPSIPEALFQAYDDNILDDNELEEVIDGLYKIDENNNSTKLNNDFIFKKHGLAKVYAPTEKTFKWKLLASPTPDYIHFPTYKNLSYNNDLTNKLNEKILLVANSKNNFFSKNEFNNEQKINIITSWVANWNKKTITNADYTRTCTDFFKCNESIINKVNNSELIKTILNKIAELLSESLEDEIKTNNELSSLINYINNLNQNDIIIPVKINDNWELLKKIWKERIGITDSKILFVPDYLNIKGKGLSNREILWQEINKYTPDFHHHLFYALYDKNRDSLQNILSKYDELVVCKLFRFFIKDEKPEERLLAYKNIKDIINISKTSALFKHQKEKTDLITIYLKYILKTNPQVNIYSVSVNYIQENVNALTEDINGILLSLCGQKELLFHNPCKDLALKDRFIITLLSYINSNKNKIKDEIKNRQDFKEIYKFILSGMNKNSLAQDSGLCYSDSEYKKSFWFTLYSKYNQTDCMIPINYQQYIVQDYLSDAVQMLSDDVCCHKLMDKPCIELNNGKKCCPNQIISDKILINIDDNDALVNCLKNKYDFVTINDLKGNSAKNHIKLLFIDQNFFRVENILDIIIKKSTNACYFDYIIAENSLNNLIFLLKESDSEPIFKIFNLISKEYQDKLEVYYKKIKNNNGPTLELLYNLLKDISGAANGNKKINKIAIQVFGDILDHYCKLSTNCPGTTRFEVLNNILYPTADGENWVSPDKIVGTINDFINPSQRLPENIYKTLHYYTTDIRELYFFKTYYSLDINSIISENMNSFVSYSIDNFVSSWTKSQYNLKIIYLLLFFFGGEYRMLASQSQPNRINVLEKNKEIKDLIDFPQGKSGIYILRNPCIRLKSLSFKAIDVKRNPKHYYIGIEKGQKEWSIYLAPVGDNLGQDAEKTIQKIIHELFNKFYLSKVYYNAAIANSEKERINNLVEKIIKTFNDSDQITIDNTINYITKGLPYTLKRLKMTKNKDANIWLSKYQENAESKEAQDALEKLRELLIDNQDFRENVYDAVVNIIKSHEYSPTSVLFELFQNADDCINELYLSDNKHSVLNDFVIKTNDQHLCVSHFGRKINSNITINGKTKGCDDLINMLSFDSTNKDSNDGDTGRFGLGFKSIYTICESPVIASGDIICKILGGMYPYTGKGKGNGNEIKLSKPLTPDETRFEIELKPEINIESVLNEFKNNIFLLPLFSKKIKKIVINDEQYQPQEDESHVFNSANIKVYKYKNYNQKYLLFTQNTGSIKYKIAFQIENNSIIPLSDKIRRIWELTPLIQLNNINLPFAIDASFEVNTGRTFVNLEKEKELLSVIGANFGEILSTIKNDSYLQNILNLLVDTLYRSNSSFKRFAKEAIASVYNVTELIPSGWNGTLKFQDNTTILSVATGNYNDNPQILLQPIQNYLDKCKQGLYKVITHNAKEALPDKISNTIKPFELSKILDFIPEKEYNGKNGKILTVDLLNCILQIPGIHGDNLDDIDKYSLINKLDNPVRCTEILFSDDAPPKIPLRMNILLK